MSRHIFNDNPDYALRWPPELFAREVELLVQSGRERSMDSNWRSEVETLLLQAFASPVPAEDFKRVLKTYAQRAARVQKSDYEIDEEPF